MIGLLLSLLAGILALVLSVLLFKKTNRDLLNTLGICLVGFCGALMMISGWTGWSAEALYGSKMGHWDIMLHIPSGSALLASAFILTLTLLVYNRRCQSQVEKNGQPRALKSTALISLSLLLLFLSLATLSILLAMFPIFGTQGQKLLFELHALSAIASIIMFSLLCIVLFKQGFKTTMSNTLTQNSNLTEGEVS